MTVPASDRVRVAWVSMSVPNSARRCFGQRLRIIACVVALMAGACGDGPSGVSISNVPDASQVGPDAKQVQPHTPPQTVGETACEPNSNGLFASYCPCEENTDCDSGYCVSSPGGMVCTEPCIANCPDDWSCELISGFGSDSTFLCVAQHPNLCRPCMNDQECQSPSGEGDERCVSYGDGGSFCAVGCAPEAQAAGCPTGYQCEVVTSQDNTLVHQCVAESGTCGCSPLAVQQVAKTACQAHTDTGTCPGVLQCVEAGENSCVPAPLPEACDGIDNDCDGAVDETCAPQVNEHLMGDGFSLSSDNGQHFLQQTIGVPRMVRTTTNGIFTLTPGLY